MCSRGKHNTPSPPSLLRGDLCRSWRMTSIRSRADVFGALSSSSTGGRWTRRWWGGGSHLLPSATALWSCLCCVVHSHFCTWAQLPLSAPHKYVPECVGTSSVPQKWYLRLVKNHFRDAAYVDDVLYPTWRSNLQLFEIKRCNNWKKALNLTFFLSLSSRKKIMSCNLHTDSASLIDPALL